MTCLFSPKKVKYVLFWNSKSEVIKMWAVFLIMVLTLFMIGMTALYFANRIMIKIKKENDQYEKEREEEDYE